MCRDNDRPPLIYHNDDDVSYGHDDDDMGMLGVWVIVVATLGIVALGFGLGLCAVTGCFR